MKHKILVTAGAMGLALLFAGCPSSLTFTFTPASLNFGLTETSQTLEAFPSGGGEGDFTFVATSQTPWVADISPTQDDSTGAANPATFVVTVDRSGLAPGTHSGTLTLDVMGTAASGILAGCCPGRP